MIYVGISNSESLFDIKHAGQTQFKCSSVFQCFTVFVSVDGLHLKADRDMRKVSQVSESCFHQDPVSSRCGLRISSSFVFVAHIGCDIDISVYDDVMTDG